jgi:hypothetical protein
MGHVRENFIAVVIFIAAALPLASPAVAQQPGSEAPLSNGDVVKLCKLGLGDDVVVAKIKQAAEVAFDVTTDGLVQLKKSGVSGAVISAMLDRGTPKAAPALVVSESAAHASARDNVGLVVDGREVRLPGSRGDLTTTGMWPVVFTFLDYPGLHARARTHETRPTLVIRAEHDPKSYYYLARLDVNDADENNRSLKIEQKMSGFSETTRVVPAGRWYVEYDAAEKAPGVWYITPQRVLQPGEYGVVAPGGTLYEFGID